MEQRKIDEIFVNQTADSIKNMYLNQGEAKDETLWKPDSSGQHLIRSFYMKDQHDRFSFLDKKNFWHKLWELNLHERIQILFTENGEQLFPLAKK